MSEVIRQKSKQSKACNSCSLKEICLPKLEKTISVSDLYSTGTEGGRAVRKLLNTLYVTSENSYLALDGENLVVYDEKKELGRLPLHNLDGIVSFGYRGTSPALMGACAERNISLCYLTPQGKFLARVTGKVQGNVLLREQQYKSSKDDEISLTIAKNCIMGKVYNARWVLERAIRDHGMQIDVEGVKKASLHLKESLQYIQNAESKDQLRGYEGEAASIYFGVFNELILQQKKEFNFQGRNKRPPKDNVNAMLSFVYTLLTNQITSALEVCRTGSLCRISSYRPTGESIIGIRSNRRTEKCVCRSVCFVT